jgi:hypothetical protein
MRRDERRYDRDQEEAGGVLQRVGSDLQRQRRQFEDTVQERNRQKQHRDCDENRVCKA